MVVRQKPTPIFSAHETGLVGCMIGKSAGLLALPEPGGHTVGLLRGIGRSNAEMARRHWAKDAR
jgi:hypothetical protein